MEIQKEIQFFFTVNIGEYISCYVSYWRNKYIFLVQEDFKDEKEGNDIYW